MKYHYPRTAEPVRACVVWGGRGEKWVRVVAVCLCYVRVLNESEHMSAPYHAWLPSTENFASRSGRSGNARQQYGPYPKIEESSACFENVTHYTNTHLVLLPLKHQAPPTAP